MSNILDRLSQIATILMGVGAFVVAGVVVHDRLVGEPASGDVEVDVDGWAEYSELGHQIGSRFAKVTIVEFGDYQCPSCRRFAPVVDSIVEQYRGRVRFVYRHWPLRIHDRAYPAARAAECADKQGRFWEFHKELYSTTSWVEGGFGDIAEKVGIEDIPAFENCNDSVEAVRDIEQDMLAADALGGRGTPTILINQTMIVGHRDVAEISRLIDSKLADP